MFPLHSNYRRDGATRPLFRSRVSMMASSCPPPPRTLDDEESSTTTTAVSPTTNHVKTASVGTFQRPRPRMWSSIPSPSCYSSGSDSDGYYSSDSSDSSEDEADYYDDDMLCDAKNDLKGNQNPINHTNKNSKKRRPISPTSCAEFDDHDRPAKRRRRRRRRSGKRVTFARDLVADVRYRPRTPPEDKRELFYSKRDISGFRRDYYDWLDDGHDPSELYDDEGDDEHDDDENENVISLSSSALPTSTTSPLHQKSTTCVTPDNSSEDEVGDEDESEEEEEED